MTTNRITASPIYVAATDAQYEFRHVLEQNLTPEAFKPYVEDFEDVMNGLSGDIQNLPTDQRNEVKLENQSLIDLGVTKSITIRLHESVLPDSNMSSGGTATTTVLAKRLYPRTESVTIESSNTTTNTGNTTPITTDTVLLGYSDAELESAEEVDEIFDELDAELEDVVQEPLATEQNETLPYLPEGMIVLAKDAASNANGLQAGLTAFSHNPLADIIEDTRELLIYYTANNYANLNVALSSVANDVALVAEYKVLRDAIGGPDGLSGCVSQLDNFKDHTDRLSGLVLDRDSPNAEPTDDSTTEDINLYDFSGGPTIIFSFNAKKFRSAKYLVQATAIAADRGHQASDLYILHDGHHAFTREVAAIYTQDPFISYTTRLLNNRVEVLATSNVANVDFVIHGTRLRIARASESYAEMSQQKIIENHELLSVYLDDGVDYVEKQSASLLKSGLVANLAREIRDLFITLNNSSWLAQSTPSKQAGLLSLAASIDTRRNMIQEAIDLDYDNFVETRKLAEALDIAYNLTVAYTDDSGNSIPKVTLNNATIDAIEKGTEE